ncbi:hypothetical protein D3C75_136230 [compost metagenome]
MKQRQVKKILKKQGKLNPEKQEPTLQEAWDTLWMAIQNDPVWLKSSGCLFAGQTYEGSEVRGTLYDAGDLRLVTSVTVPAEGHFQRVYGK